MVGRGSLRGKAKIGMRVGRVINKYKVAKHFELTIEEASLRYRMRRDRVAAVAALDGIYVVRTSIEADVMPDADVIRCFKRLTRVERAFRSLKTVDLKVRPVYHHTSDRVRAHVFLCMLAYYVEWHLRRAWVPMLFDDEVDDWLTRDLVAASTRSASAQQKAQTQRTTTGEVVHSFQSMLETLSSVVKNVCRRSGASAIEPTFEMTTRPDAVQSRALRLAAAISPLRNQKQGSHFRRFPSRIAELAGDGSGDFSLALKPLKGPVANPQLVVCDERQRGTSGLVNIGISHELQDRRP